MTLEEANHSANDKRPAVSIIDLPPSSSTPQQQTDVQLEEAATSQLPSVSQSSQEPVIQQQAIVQPTPTTQASVNPLLPQQLHTQQQQSRSAASVRFGEWSLPPSALRAPLSYTPPRPPPVDFDAMSEDSSVHQTRSSHRSPQQPAQSHVTQQHQMQDQQAMWGHFQQQLSARQELVDKLPPHLRLDWALYKRNAGQVDLGSFCDYMNAITSAASDVAHFTDFDGVRPCGHDKQKKDKAFVNAHVSEPRKLEQQRKKVDTQDRPCYVCQSISHRIKDCSKFKSLSLGERQQNNIWLHNNTDCSSQQQQQQQQEQLLGVGLSNTDGATWSLALHLYQHRDWRVSSSASASNVSPSTNAGLSMTASVELFTVSWTGTACGLRTLRMGTNNDDQLYYD
nr:uncharacterized protein LOC115265156 [Aedes albopictus]